MKKAPFQLLLNITLFFLIIWQTKASTVAVHDPSVVVVYRDAGGNSFPVNDAGGTRSKYYYIFGTQLGAAYSTDMLNWTPFTPTFSLNGSVSTDYYQIFKMEADYAEQLTTADVHGNLWAPDVIYNRSMKKWCMYFSLSGQSFKSSIIMLTSDKIEGPYVKTGDVVFGGFTNATNSIAKDDFKKVTGTSTIPSRYLKSDGTWFNDYSVSCIDPCILYDESGKLWVSYGSWSGGIFLLKLSETTGLRDYTYNYGYTAGNNGATMSGTTLKFDPYMGIHIGGGYYVSGEGSYIEYIKDANGTGYYYLFVSMGFYSPDGGYTMRVFRSQTINGDYKDVTGDNAAFSQWVFDYGNNVQYGMPIMQNYKWKWWTLGDVAQGHNSLLQDEDGSAYMIYHTKYDNKTIWHNVEVHQLFFNEKGWPLASPFEFRKKEGLTSKTYTAEDIAGSYGVIAHKPVDYANLATNQEQQMYINADGTLSGAYIGTWKYGYASGRQFLTLTTSEGTFDAVLCEQLMDGLSSKTIAFTGMNAANEQCLWGYRNTNTATTNTTYYRGQSLIVGPKDYSLFWNDYAKFNQQQVSGDFEIEYTFITNTLGAQNYHNWAIAFTDGSATWHLRADAFSNTVFSGSKVNYTYTWDWATFKEVFKNKEARVKVSRIGTTINVFGFVGDILVYTSSSVNSSVAPLTVSLGGESCYLDVKKISLSQLGTRQLVGTANDDGTYTSPFNVSKGAETTVSGDFDLTYTFNNYHNSVSTNNWDNYIIRATSGSSVMLIRADAFVISGFGTSTFSYDWDWANFLSLISSSNVVMKITRGGSTITYTAVITAKDGKIYNYKVMTTGAPTTDMKFGFTCEASLVDLLEAEKTTYVGTDIINGTQEDVSESTGLKIYASENILYVVSDIPGRTIIYDIEGRPVREVVYLKGANNYTGLNPGLYLVKGQKVIIR